MTLIKILVLCVAIAWAMGLFYTMALFLEDTSIVNILLFGGFLMVPSILTANYIFEKK